jgi:hypothetical protein
VIWNFYSYNTPKPLDILAGKTIEI